MKKKIAVFIALSLSTSFLLVFFNASKLDQSKKKARISIKDPRLSQVLNPYAIKASFIDFKRDQVTANRIFFDEYMNHILIPINIKSKVYRLDHNFEEAEEHISCSYSINGDTFQDFNQNMNLYEHSNGLDLYAHLRISESMGAEKNIEIKIVCSDSRELYAMNTLEFMSTPSPLVITHFTENLSTNGGQVELSGSCDSSIASTVQVQILQSNGAMGPPSQRYKTVNCNAVPDYGNAYPHDMGRFRVVFQNIDQPQFPIPNQFNINQSIFATAWFGNQSQTFELPVFMNIEQRIRDSVIID